MLWKRKKRASPARFYLRKQRSHMNSTATVASEATALHFAPGQRLLFVHAHPDDETVATGEAIEQSAESGAATHVLTATRGGQTTHREEDPDHPWGKNDTIETVREAEVRRALGDMGIAHENQHVLDLPDGKLGKPFNKTRLAWHIATIIVKNRISTVVTPGPGGFDGHPDHIAVHKAALLVVKLLRLLGKDTGLLANNRDGKGELFVRVNQARKLARLRNHYSQFAMWTASDAPNRKGLVAARSQHGFYQTRQTADYLDLYEALMSEQETYDRVY